MSRAQPWSILIKSLSLDMQHRLTKAASGYGTITAHAQRNMKCFVSDHLLWDGFSHLYLSTVKTDWEGLARRTKRLNSPPRPMRSSLFIPPLSLSPSVSGRGRRACSQGTRLRCAGARHAGSRHLAAARSAPARSGTGGQGSPRVTRRVVNAFDFPQNHQ